MCFDFLLWGYLRIVCMARATLIAIMDYGDVRGVQLEVDGVAGIRTLSWYVESDEPDVWEKHTLTLLPGETHPMIEMWKMALEKQGDTSQDDVFDRQTAVRRRPTDSSRRSAKQTSG